MNTLTILFRAIECNGYPAAKIFLNSRLVHDIVFEEDETEVSIPVAHDAGSSVLTVERYGKTRHNMVINNGTIEKDQILEILDVRVDNISFPEFYFADNCVFEFLDQQHVGSRYFGPNGTWTLKFGTPLITHLLDAKILHESQYSQDYEYPWSYRLGPNTAEFLLSEMDKVEQRVHQVL
jgi:hypothetical protein